MGGGGACLKMDSTRKNKKKEEKMLTSKDIAIAHGITRAKIIATFHKNTKVLKNGCIVWTKSLNEGGYGQMGIALNKRTHPVYVHRFAWALKNGMAALPIGGQLKGSRHVLNHMCHNRACVNTNHLEVVLQSENISPDRRKPKNGKTKKN